jgi:hypothetical protein
MVFEKRVLRRIFGPKKEEVAGGWRGLYDEELHNWYSSSHINRVIKIKEDEMEGACSTHEKYEKHIQYFSCKTSREEITRKI